MEPNSTDREVAYCRRVDTAPEVDLAEGSPWVVLGATNVAVTDSLPAASCRDSETTNIAAPDINLGNVDTSVAGNYDAAGPHPGKNLLR